MNTGNATNLRFAPKQTHKFSYIFTWLSWVNTEGWTQQWCRMRSAKEAMEWITTICLLCTKQQAMPNACWSVKGYIRGSTFMPYPSQGAATSCLGKAWFSAATQNFKLQVGRVTFGKTFSGKLFLGHGYTESARETWVKPLDTRPKNVKAGKFT